MQKSNKGNYSVNYWVDSKGADQVLYSNPKKVPEVINLLSFAEKKGTTIVE